MDRCIMPTMQMVIMMVILSFLLSKIQNYIYTKSLYQQKTREKCQSLLVKVLKERCAGINIKQKVRIKTRQTSIDIFSNRTL